MLVWNEIKTLDSKNKCSSIPDERLCKNGCNGKEYPWLLASHLSRDNLFKKLLLYGQKGFVS